MLLFHTNSPFSVVDTEIQLLRATQVTQQHWPVVLLTYHCWHYDVISLMRGLIRTYFRTKDI